MSIQSTNLDEQLYSDLDLFWQIKTKELQHIFKQKIDQHSNHIQSKFDCSQISLDLSKCTT